MSGTFDDFASLAGTGHPDQEAVIRVRDYLKRHNRNHDVRTVADEMKGMGWSVSPATVQRRLDGVKGGNPSRPNDLMKEVSERRDDRKKSKGKPNLAEAPIKTSDLLDDPTVIAKLADLVKDGNSSTMLAVRENRARMALNVIIAETMAANSKLLLLDMRGTAALVDALTSGTKLSGGHAIDITIPTDEDRKNAQLGISPTGNAMKDITPQPEPALVTSIARWKRDQKNGGQGA